MFDQTIKLCQKFSVIKLPKQKFSYKIQLKSKPCSMFFCATPNNLSITEVEPSYSRGHSLYKLSLIYASELVTKKTLLHCFIAIFETFLHI